MKLSHLFGFHLLNSRQKNRGLYVCALLLFAALLDLFSLASFFPLILLVIQHGNLHSQNILTEQVYALTGLSEPVHLGTLLTLFAILLVIIKAQINTKITLKKSRYAYGVAREIALQALKNFWAMPYQDFLKSDYTIALNRINNLPLAFANNILIPLGTILSEVLITSLLLVALVLFNLHAFLFVTIAVIPMMVVYRFKRKSIAITSREVKTSLPLSLKKTLQSIEAWIEIKTFNKQTYFEDTFNETYSKLGNTFAKDHSAHIASSRFGEILVAICVGSLIIYTTYFQQSKQESMLLLAVYAGASFRIIPSLNRIFSAVLQLKTHRYIIEELDKTKERSYSDDPKHTNANVLFHKTIELKNICFGYKHQENILEDVTLNISKGDKIMLLGKSGSGKTTLFMILMRFLNEHEGQILLDGNMLYNEDDEAFRKIIGYVSQNPYLLDASVAENIAFGLNDIDHEKLSRILRDLGMEQWINSLPDKAQTTIGEKGVRISGGQRQRLALARALYHNAEILLLDEVTNQLDDETELEVMKAIYSSEAKNKTILLITHRPELWNGFDKRYKIENKTLIPLKVESAQ